MSPAASGGKGNVSSGEVSSKCVVVAGGGRVEMGSGAVPMSGGAKGLQRSVAAGSMIESQRSSSVVVAGGGAKGLPWPKKWQTKRSAAAWLVREAQRS